MSESTPNVERIKRQNKKTKKEFRKEKNKGPRYIRMGQASLSRHQQRPRKDAQTNKTSS